MIRTHSGAALVVLTLLAGCETTQQAATSPDYQKTRTGAGIGAGVGAVAGLLVGGGTFQSALVGAAIGGIAGGAIGNYQDKQEAQLRSSMAGTGVEVVRKQDNITLDMPAGITFATNSSDLNSAFFPILDKVAATLEPVRTFPTAPPERERPNTLEQRSSAESTRQEDMNIPAFIRKKAD